MKRIAAWFMSALLAGIIPTGCSAGKTETEDRGKSYFTYFDTVSLRVQLCRRLGRSSLTDACRGLAFWGIPPAL